MPPKPGRPPVPTHFLCIPLVSPLSRPQLAASLAAFRADVCCSPYSAAGGPPLAVVPEDAVRPVGTLHLTLGVFSFPPPAGNKNGQGGGRGGPVQEQGAGTGSEGDAAVVGEGSPGGVGNGAENRPQGEEEGGDKPAPTLDRAKEVLAGLRLREIWQAVKSRPSSTARVLAMPGAGQQGIGEQQQQQQQQQEEEQQGDDRPRITLRGLASMQVPAKAAVLYAPPVDPLGLLQAFCERVRDAFREADVMVDEGRPLLLHATVVNTVYSKQKVVGVGQGEGAGRRRGGGRGGKGNGGSWGRGKRERLVFDASGLVERYEDLVWMEDVPVEKVAICKMGAKKVVVDGVEDEAYEVEAEVAF